MATRRDMKPLGGRRRPVDGTEVERPVLSTMDVAVPVERVEASAYTIPTDAPEADGTFRWSTTTLVLVQVEGGGRIGTGWTYGSMVTAALVRNALAPILEGRVFDSVPQAWTEQVIALRNIGRPGIGAMAVSAVDCALWDLQARLADVPLHQLLGAQREAVPLYGSGGFTSYDDAQLHPLALKRPPSGRRKHRQVLTRRQEFGPASSSQDFGRTRPN